MCCFFKTKNYTKILLLRKFTQSQFVANQYSKCGDQCAKQKDRVSANARVSLGTNGRDGNFFDMSTVLTDSLRILNKTRFFILACI